MWNGAQRKWSTASQICPVQGGITSIEFDRLAREIDIDMILLMFIRQAYLQLAEFLYGIPTNASRSGGDSRQIADKKSSKLRVRFIEARAEKQIMSNNTAAAGPNS